MKSAETIPGVLVLIARLALLPPDRWALDWVAAAAALWIALTLTREDSTPRRWSLALACAWLGVIYAVHQGPWTLAGWR